MKKNIWIAYDINGMGGVNYICSDCSERSVSIGKFCPHCGNSKKESIYPFDEEYTEEYFEFVKISIEKSRIKSEQP